MALAGPLASVRAEDDDIRIPDAHVEEALQAAGANRTELRKVIDHFARIGDGRKLTAARFLIANMPGHAFIITRLCDRSGKTIPFDPLAYENHEQALRAFEALEARHGKLTFARDRKVKDLETVKADYLIRHIEEAFRAWESWPPGPRVGFGVFLNHVLPYRGSQEPVSAWIEPLARRYADLKASIEAGASPGELHRAVVRDVHRRVRFNERYYLHPTDQGFEEMEASKQGRCEDITNMLTYASRSLAIATAADYTPWWAHRDNNHAWNVILDAQGRGHDPANAHAAKVYRKTYAIQRDSLACRLPEGEQAPNRFLRSRFYRDVTDQYRPTTDVELELDRAAEGERFVYLCVFNGGEWKAIHWGESRDGRVTFDRMGRRVAYLPAVYRNGELIPAGAPFLLLDDGSVRPLAGTGKPVALIATAVRPRQVSPDTRAETPVSYLKHGGTYRLQRWARSGWTLVKEFTAENDAPPRFEALPADGLYWMVRDGSRRLERIFTIEAGRQRWW